MPAEPSLLCEHGRAACAETSVCSHTHWCVACIPARRPSKWAGWHLDVVGTERHVSQGGIVGLPLSVGHGEEVGYLVSTSSGHMVWVGLRGQLCTPCPPKWPALPPAHHALAA